MNRAYRLVWSRVNNAWVVASEIARGRGKSSGCKLAPLVLSLLPVLGQASPIGGMVTSGIGTINQAGSITTIRQSSQNLSLNWQSFNIAKTETVNFLQPSASAIAVNRIFDTAGTLILGHLNANGQIWLINPNGILFGAGAQVNVGGLVASTLDTLSSSGSSTTFSGTGTGQIANQGTISGHYVAFIGNSVGNNGTITSNLGAVALGGGSRVTLTFAGNDLVKMQVDASVLNSLAQNGGLIQANGGMVIMTTGAKDSLLASVVNNTGVIEARAVNDQSGTITLLGGMSAGTVNVGGTLDASAPNGGNGGSIETSAHEVNIANDAVITTAAAQGLSGTWLIDPVDFTIAASGGNETGAQLSTALGSGNVTILSSSGTTGTSGDINVNDAVSWSANTTLTLSAYNNINIDSSITSSGAAGAVALYYGQGAVAAGNTSTYSFGLTGSGFAGQINLQAGNNFSTKLGSDGAVVNYTVITTLGLAGDATTAPGTATLQGMAAAANLAGNYVLGANIDATSTSGWNSGAGFAPIGNSTTNFTGTFDGLGHTITNLTINLPSSNYVGLFGYTGTGSVIRNVGLVVGNVTGSTYVGTLVGGNYSSITNSYSTGGVTSNGGLAGDLVGWNNGAIASSYATGSVGSSNGNLNNFGGLVGWNNDTIENSYATGAVSVSGSTAGGLVGFNSQGTIENSYATGSVNGGFDIGGLAGVSNSAISNSYATGAVTGSRYVGGLAGANHGTISNSHSTSGVTSTGNDVGGLAGQNYGTVENSYATGTVSSTGSNVGGLVGATYGTSTISDSYATGNVSDTGSYVGGLVGLLGGGTISNSYATGNVSNGGAYSGGLVGASYSTISNSFYDNQTTGQTQGSGSYPDAAGTVWGMSTANMQTQANFTSATSANGNVNPGWDFANTWVMYDGYTYPLLRAFMTPLTVTAGGATTYNGTAVSGLSGLSYSISNVNTSHLLGTTVYSNAGMVNAGSYANVTVSGLYSDQGGYIISYGSPATVTVNQLASATWVGGATGNWSSPANWAPSANLAATGAIPDYANVASVIIPAGVTVTYDSGVAGTTTLSSLNISNANTFNVAGGTLSVLGGNTSVAALNLSGGTLNMAGGLAAGTYNQTGGTWSQVAATLPAFSATSFSVSGGTFIRATGGNGTSAAPYQLADIYGVQGMNTGLADSYVLANDIVATGTANWNAGAGFAPIGNNSTSSTVSQFTGTFDGLGHTITGLTINAPNANYVGLFGYAGTGSVIRNVGLVGGSVSGYGEVGGLAGTNYGAISSSYATGRVMSSGGNVGGLVGENFGSIGDSYATGYGGGRTAVGGLVGSNNGGTISNSYAMGNVSSGSGYIGGLVGANGSNGAISDSYATGSVTSSSVSNVGGLAGSNGGAISNSFYDTTTTGQAQGIGGTADVAGIVYGMSTAAMQTQANFTSATAANGNVNPNWDFTTPVWAFRSGVNNNYPVLCILGACTAASSGSSDSLDSLDSTAENVTTQLLSSMGGQSLGSGGNSASGGNPASGDDSGESGSNPEGSGPPQNGAPPNLSQNVVFALGSTGSLQIVNGGLRLPDEMLGPNGGQDTDNSNSQSR